MPTSFLLRFQEECVSKDIPGTHCDTKTLTKIKHEGNDLQSTEIYALSRLATYTETRVAREGTDKFDANNRMHAIKHHSMVMATKTMTEVKAESPDQDDRRSVSMRAIPPLYAASNGTTKTSTAVRAETDDRDADRHQPFHVIR
jgi:hypothetical protein